MLTPGKTGSKWTLRSTSPITGKRSDAGLRGYPDADACDKALGMRRLIDAGKDPIEERDREQQATSISAAALTFGKAARQVHEEMKPGWKNRSTPRSGFRRLRPMCFPKLGGKSLDAITPADSADALRPIWLEKSETASRTRQRMRAVIQWAWAHGHITANPVSVADHVQSQQNAKKEHQPATPWRDLAAFVKKHVAEYKQGKATRAALLFLILTAARSGEVRGATWEEFDLKAGIRTVPGERMKAKEPHRVPLSSAALELVKRLKEQKLHETLVFPSPRRKVLSDMVLTSFLRRVEAKSDTPGRVATAHGFRGSFRDWASENGYARGLAERALAYTVANKVEAAYHRTDLLDQRPSDDRSVGAHLLLGNAP